MWILTEIRAGLPGLLGGLIGRLAPGVRDPDFAAFPSRDA